MKIFSFQHLLCQILKISSIVFYSLGLMCSVSQTACALDVDVQGGSAAAGQPIDIVLTIANNTAGLYGAEITLQWDSSALTIDSVENGTLAQNAGLTLFANTDQAGEARITQYHYSSVFSDTQGQMLILHGTVSSSAAPGDYTLTISQADFIDGQVQFITPDTIIHGTLTVQGLQLTADLNSDGSVNYSDFMLLLNQWGRTDMPPGDINRDGIVDYSDFMLLLNKWTG